MIKDIVIISDGNSNIDNPLYNKGSTDNDIYCVKKRVSKSNEKFYSKFRLKKKHQKFGNSTKKVLSFKYNEVGCGKGYQSLRFLIDYKKTHISGKLDCNG